MPTVHIALSDEEYERLRRMAAHLGASTDAAARSLLRAALEQRELAPAERLLRAIEEVYRQHGTLKTSDSTAIVASSENAMSEIVVDASVAVKWLIQEEHSEDARLLLTFVPPSISLIAPDVIVPEIGHALRRLVNRGELQSVQAEALYNAFVENNPLGLFSLSWRPEPATTLAQEAMRLGNQHLCSFYDALYIALAVKRNGVLVTADRRLYEKPLPLQPGQDIIWIADLAEWLSRVPNR